MGRVEAIFISRQKKTEREEINEGHFIKNFGLEGDAYSSPGAKRQVTILSSKGRAAVEQEGMNGLCFERFLETVRISGIDADALKPGAVLVAGRALFEVTEYRKKCYPECTIVQSGRVCSLATDVRFLKVLRTGKVSVGDRVEIIKEYDILHSS